jgi:hypothetical protein
MARTESEIEYKDLLFPLAYISDKKVKRFHFNEIISKLLYIRATVIKLKIILSRFKISIYKNFLDYLISYNIDLKRIIIKVNDRSSIDLIFKKINFFRNLSRGLRFGKIFNII